MTKPTLRVSEMFYSIQGEGPFCGQPSVFLRLQGCNLTCGGKTTLKSKQCEEGATWRCDSIEVWTKGKQWGFDEICKEWEDQHWIQKLKNGAHLIITGGEPLLQIQALELFLTYYLERYKQLPFIEIETNGTIEPSSLLRTYINHYNVSFKLTNSGLKKQQYYLKKAIQYFAKLENAIFKFVVSSKEDVKELELLYISPFQLKQSKIILMPSADNRQALKALEPGIIEFCKEKSWRYSTRLHIEVWDKKTGV